MSSSPSKILEVFDNPNEDRDFVIRIDTSEFTCLCPLTGQPDFADIHIEYIADKYCVELKALKNYFWSYRNEGACLLYTSPSPRDLSTSRMPSSA